MSLMRGYARTPPVALVVGGTGGIGSTIVTSLLRNEYLVCRTGNTQCPEEMRLDESFVHCDMEDKPSIGCVICHMKSSYARCDLLVVAHGASPFIVPTVELSSSEWNHILNVDVTGTFLLCREIGKMMIEQGGGSIVLISSMHALGTYPERTAYATAKTAVCGLARSLAVEWGQYGIRVNAIAPGQVEGPRTQKIANAQGDDVIDKMRSRSPSRQFVNPEDIAETVLWLTKTPSVTGQTIVLDHGVTVNNWYESF